MSLVLNRSFPKMIVKTTGGSKNLNKMVFFVIEQKGESSILVEISMDSFLCAAEYVFTNTELFPRDPRHKWLKRLKTLKPIKGKYNGKGHRALGHPDEEKFYTKK